MSSITVRAQYNRAKRALFLENDLPDTESESLTLRIHFVRPDYEEVKRADFFDALHAAYGIAPESADGVSYVRAMRDAADKRVKALWR